MIEANLLSTQNGIQITQKVLIHIAEHQKERAKSQKIFINHTTKDKAIVDKLVALFEKNGCTKESAIF